MFEDISQPLCITTTSHFSQQIHNSIDIISPTWAPVTIIGQKETARALPKWVCL